MKKLSYSKRNLIRVIVSFVVAIVGLQLISLSEKVANDEKKVIYLAAGEEMEVGVEVTEDLLSESNSDGAPEFKYLTQKSEILGMIVKEKIYKDEPITTERLDIKQDFDKITKKHYSIKLPPESAVAGTIKPGDKVKVIGTVVNSTSDANTEFIIKDEKEQPKSVNVLEVYDMNGSQIKDPSMVPGIYVLELSSEEAIILDKAAAIRNIKLIGDTQ